MVFTKAAAASGVLPGSFAMVENTVPGAIEPDPFGFRFGKPGLAADTLSKKLPAFCGMPPSPGAPGAALSDGGSAHAAPASGTDRAAAAAAVTNSFLSMRFSYR